MRLLIKDASVVTLDPARPLLAPGYVSVQDGRIEAVSDQPPVGPWDEVIEGKGQILMPGLVNAHTHVAMTLLRGYADDMELMPWLQTKIWPIEARIGDEDVYWGSLLGIAEMLLGGVTTFCDMYYAFHRTAAAVEESGMRAVLSGVLLGFLNSAQADLEAACRFAREWHGAAGGRISAMLGPHAAYTCPDPLLRQVISAARELGIGLHIHVSETEQEVEASEQSTGLPPVLHLERLGAFELHPVLAAHCVHVSPQEIEVLARHQVGIAHNPGSNMKLASGLAPVCELLARGARVGIGTDGAASNNNLDVLEEVRLAALLAKVREADPTALPAHQALYLGTRGGALALGLEDVGLIAPGFRADLVLLEARQPHLVPPHNLVSHLVYAARAGDVRTVLVDGRVVVRDRELLTLDLPRVMAEATRRGQEIVAGRRPRRR